MSDDQPGTVEAQVRADLAALGELDKGMRGSLAAIAITLARALDRAAEDEDLGKIAQVSLQLRQTLASMSDVSKDASLLRQLVDFMQTPVDACPECQAYHSAEHKDLP